MAINSSEITSNKSQPYSLVSKVEHLNPSHLMKIDFAKNDNIVSSVSKCGKLKQNNNFKSPYLSGDSVHLLSRVNEKRFLHKGATDFVSSFPLALNIYRANSDEFKTRKGGRKKIKKSVLTLPNEPAPMPQTCTVSDMNDSEYFSRENENRISNITERLPVQRKKKTQRSIKKSTEFYDRDARYCSQLSIDLDCSSTDVIKSFKRSGLKGPNKLKVQKNLQLDNKFNAHNVWAALRNMNRFQFNPSPPMSEDSTVSSRKTKGFNKNRMNRKNTGYVETCRTEEFAYISSIDIDKTSFSQTSSFDRITVIDKEDDLNVVYKEFGRHIDNGKAAKPKNVKKRNLGCNKFFAKKLLENNNKANRTNDNNNKSIPSKKFENYLIAPYSRNKDTMNGKSFVLSNKDSQNSNESQKFLIFNNKENDSVNKLNHNEGNIKPVATNDKIVYSITSGSSKVALQLHNLKDKEKSLKTSPNISKTQINGITKVVLKGQDINTSKRNFESPKRKPRLVTTMPSTEMTSKLTQSEIKRRLAQIKYPIVVLGKDEISSTIKVVNYDPPQFNGLDKHIWPFMLNWSNGSCDNTIDIKVDSKVIPLTGKVNAKRISHIENTKVLRKVNNVSLKKVSVNKVHEMQNLESTKVIGYSKELNKKNEQKRRYADCNNLNEIKPESKTQIQNLVFPFKDKMLKLLYRKSSKANVVKKNCQKFQQSNLNNAKNVPTKTISTPKYIDASTETYIQNDQIMKKNISGSLFTLSKKLTTMKYPWAKGKYASDFIENVIRKLKEGVYYTHERKDVNSWISHDFKDASVQTSVKSTASNTNYCCLELRSTQSRNDPFKSVFGFGDKVPLLEIVTMTANQIAVKHCMKNIVIQFDVETPVESSTLVNVKDSFSCIPIDGTDSQPKVFKCKTTIINAMLPSELCSVLPKMVSNLTDFKEKQVSLPVTIDKKKSNLSTISELSRCESPDLFKPVPPNAYVPLNRSVEGTFSNRLFFNLSRSKYHIINRILTDSVDYMKKKPLITELLPKLPSKLLFLYNLWTSDFKINSHKVINNLCGTRVYNTRVFKETASVTDKFSGNSLIPNNNEIIPVTIRSDLSTTMVENLEHYTMKFDVRNISYIQLLKFNNNYSNNITVNMIIGNVQDAKKEILTLTLNDLKISSLFNVLSSVSAVDIDTFDTKDDILLGRCNKYASHSHENKMENKECTRYQPKAINRYKKRGFVKLYRKCKSTSNISGERCSTALSKINNLDEVFQALGSGKLLSSIFDGKRGNSILSSLAEMKSWITEITSRQIMLVILLINKKDTPNLIRFRPLILQGIAVNRITRASELDMEIEVIERETLNGSMQYEGISYLPASIENRDNLLEELYWIAKTTASDYQRPFDESSERLLRSLLEKRKKLNPSYLRVMARYVGLGLLKSSNKS